MSSRHDTRALILDRAWALLESQGAPASLEEVARAAGVSRQAVYLHFESRARLLRAVIDHASQRMDRAAIVRETEREGTVAEVLTRLGRSFGAWWPRTYAASLAVEALAARDPVTALEMAARPDNRAEVLRRVAIRLDAVGALAASVDDATDLMWAHSAASFYELLAVRRGWGPDRYAAHLTAVLSATLVLPGRLDRFVPAAHHPPHPQVPR